MTTDTPLLVNLPTLSGLTPGETVFLRNPSGVKGEDILRITLQDLLLRRVLDFMVRPHPKNPRIKMYILKHGREFHKTHALPHEQLVTHALRVKAFVDLRHVTDEWLRACGSTAEFYRDHLKTNRIEPYMEDKFRDRWLGRRKLNESGEKLVLRIEHELNEARTVMLAEADALQQQVLINAVGGHIMLTESKEWQPVKLLSGVGILFDQCMGLATERAYGD